MANRTFPRYRMEECQKCSSDGCNGGPMRDIELGLLSTDPERPLFSTDEMFELRECIVRAIIHKVDDTLSPQFISVQMRTGFLVGNVANNITKDWLRTYAEEIGNSCIPFKVVEGDDIPQSHLVKGDFLGANRIPEWDIKKYIEVQNPTLLAHNWRIIETIPIGDDATLIISIDQGSAEQLKMIGGNISYRLGTVHLTFVEGDKNRS